MTPTINVNLTPCSCPPHRKGFHYSSVCGAASVLIPCPIPRSVTFEVRLGKCHNADLPEPERMGRRCISHPCDVTRIEHSSACPARPIRVTCSIGGETWEESEVDSTEAYDLSEHEALTTTGVVRDRWALVKALVLGESLGRRSADSVDAGVALVDLFGHRDAVFDALCDMARAEEAQGRASSVVADVVGLHWPWGTRTRETAGTEAPSSRALSALVAHIIERVGALS